jgi:DNA/RNA endonuclease YhcR with UshA esterase domain
MKMILKDSLKGKTVIMLLALILAFSGCTQNNSPETRYEITPTTIQNTVTEKATNCITANESWAKIGESACVEYLVTNAFKSSGGNIFLNEKSDYKTGFTTTIFASSAKNFNDTVNEYNFKTIQVTGLIKLYDGHPEIIAETGNQIKLIE